MKICKTCKLNKDLKEYHFKKSGKFKVNAHCKVCVCLNKKEYYKNNKDKKKNYYILNKIKINRYKQKYNLYKYKTDIQFKLKTILRSRINSGLRCGSSVKDLGCSIADFKAYIESKFKNGMNWDNHGEWHLDHIKPLSSFNLKNRFDFLKACNYKNIQPLWAKENLKKGSKDFNE